MRKRFLGITLIICLIVGIFCGCAEQSTADMTEPSSDVFSDPTVEFVTEEETQATTQTETEPSTETQTEPETEPSMAQPEETSPEPEELFALMDSSVVLTEKGQTLELYCGDVPMENVSWFSADESVALFSQGTVVAIDRGITVVYAKYRDRIVFCEVECDVDPEDPYPYISKTLLHAPRLGAPYVEDPEDTSFFDDAAFIGDSVSYVLQQWNAKNACFGSAVFLARSSLGLQNTIDGRLKVSYQGVSYSPEDALAAVGAKKVFVMLGFNDIALFGLEGTMERWEIFLGRIVEKCPDIEIYIQSCTPIHEKGEYSKLNNDIVDEYNAALEAYCAEMGYHFVNIAPYFKDFTNCMASKFSSDQFMHITYDGAVVWEKALKAYAAEQMKMENEGESQ